MSSEKDSLNRLLAVMAKLRDPESGCPWDIKQTFETIAPYTIEEAYEVADAIAKGDREEIKEECGDLLFQVVFYAQLGKEEGSFTFSDIADSMSEKLVRRHPHVFAEQTQMSLDELNIQWEQIKQSEKAEQGDIDNSTTSVFNNVPSGLPSLKLAYKLQRACAKVGFDWPDPGPVLDKVKEELDEIDQAVSAKDANAVEEEIGDALFALVNLARHHNIDADHALRQASHKFQKRFELVEKNLQDKPLNQYSLDEMESAWQIAKTLLKENTKSV